MDLIPFSFASSKSPVQKNMETRFLSHESWRQALFGSHPRHVIIADSTAVQITDTRVHTHLIIIYTCTSKENCMKFIQTTFTCELIYESLIGMK